MISNLYFIDVVSMLYLYYLLLLIMQINLGNTYHLNIPIIYHLNIPLTIEKEEDGRLPFLDINNFRENNKFAINVYRKKTFSGAYTNFKSLIPETCKIGLIKSLLFRCFSLCSDFIKFHREIKKLKSILYKNSYPRDLVDKFIKEFLVKIVAPKPIVRTVPKKNYHI